MEEFDELTETLLKLLANFGPVQRRKAMRAIATYLRKAQRKRIKQNIQPDGSKMQARRKGKKKMFQKMGRFMKNKVDADHAETGFYGRTGWVANNHQLGRQMKYKNWTFQLPLRELMGLPAEDKQAIKEILLNHANA